MRTRIASTTAPHAESAPLGAPTSRSQSSSPRSSYGTAGSASCTTRPGQAVCVASGVAPFPAAAQERPARRKTLLVSPNRLLVALDALLERRANNHAIRDTRVQLAQTRP